MRTATTRGSAAGLLLLALLAFGCMAEGSYYGADYYGAYPVQYGGWRPTYYVAPYYPRVHPRFEHGGHEPHHAYRPAPASRPIPSIPSHPRPAGGHGSGHGGGHH